MRSVIKIRHNRSGQNLLPAQSRTRSAEGSCWTCRDPAMLSPHCRCIILLNFRLCHLLSALLFALGLRQSPVPTATDTQKTNLSCVLLEPGNVVCQDMPFPSYGDDDVLVEVVCSGICGSDLHVFAHGGESFRLIKSAI